MKKIFIIILTLCTSTMLQAQDPITEIIKAGIKKIIVAVDLKVQRLQNETIRLQNAQKLVENLMSKSGLENIAGWMEKQKQLYQEYYDDLRKIKNTVAAYHKIKDILAKQVSIVNTYKYALANARKDTQLTFAEISQVTNMYSAILSESLANVEQLVLVLSKTLTMEDAARMKIIDGIADKVDDNHRDLQLYARQNSWLTDQRKNYEAQIRYMQNLHGITR
jgi:hypothetical protein